MHRLYLMNGRKTRSSVFLKTYPCSKQQSHANSNSQMSRFSPSSSSPTKKYHLVPTNYVTSTRFSREVDLSNAVMASNKMVSNFVRSGDLGKALDVFERMPVKTTASWNSILAWYSKKVGKFREARQLFDRIPEPDNISYNTMLSCYLCNFGIEAASMFFHKMPVKDSTSWNTMISGFSRNGMMANARDFFNTMPKKNIVSWNAMISGYVEAGHLDKATELFQTASVNDVIPWTAMIAGYMRFGNVEQAENLFNEMPCENLIASNTMISGFVENGRFEDGLKVFLTMLESGMRPNEISMSSVLLCCSNLSALKLGKQMHQFVLKSLLHFNTTVGNSLISMYSKCGDLVDAWKLFEETQHKDVVTWNAMISSYAQHGNGKKALWLFSKMIYKRIEPDWITFVGVLSACNHAGFVELGVQYFETMQRDYKIEAKPDHYTCMVDLLGRAGKLSEAVDLIKRMAFKPHSRLFGTLLGACRIHKSSDVAEFAAKNLLNCDPTNAAAYVQLANVYAAMNKWDHVSRIRKSMEEKNVIKLPGYSWIEIKGGVVHEFRSGDKFHPELKLIRKKLRDLEKEMKLRGYTSNVECALHDVGEEVKEELLLWHSERLAIAFGLIKIPSGDPIRVFKNLRFCGDCHEATKYMSAIEGRAIIVRDTTRFHHFLHGVCSCGDYW